MFSITFSLHAQSRLTRFKNRFGTKNRVLIMADSTHLLSAISESIFTPLYGTGEERRRCGSSTDGGGNQVCGRKSRTWIWMEKWLKFLGAAGSFLYTHSLTHELSSTRPKKWVTIIFRNGERGPWEELLWGLKILPVVNIYAGAWTTFYIAPLTNLVQKTRFKVDLTKAAWFLGDIVQYLEPVCPGTM